MPTSLLMNDLFRGRFCFFRGDEQIGVRLGNLSYDDTDTVTLNSVGYLRCYVREGVYMPSWIIIGHGFDYRLQGTFYNEEILNNLLKEIGLCDFCSLEE